jgi:hypothetical protein
MKMAIARGRIKSLVLVSALSGGLIMLGAVSASATPTRSGPTVSTHHIATSATPDTLCPSHDFCAYSNIDFDIGSGGSEWVWNNYSYNLWYYVGNAENDQWYSWASGRGWETGIGLNNPESNGNVWACVPGGGEVAFPGNWPVNNRSISEEGSVSSVRFFNTSNMMCP